MGITNIKKQLQLSRLISQTQGIIKLNFVSSPKKRIFAIVNQQRGLPRESAFSLFRLTVKLGHFHRNVKSRNKANGFSLALYSYCTTYNKWGSFKKPYLLFTTMGVQALRSEIGRNGWLHFLRYG